MKLTSVILFACMSVFCLLGCGGGGFNVGNYVGTYDGSGSVDRGKTGTLHFTTDAEGIIAGTFVVNGTETTGTGFNFAPGTYVVVGSVTSTNGGFTISGSVPDQGDFVIRGPFPSLTQSREYKIRANADNFTGTLVKTD